MQAFNLKKHLCPAALLLLSCVGASVQAATLSVNCGGTYGLTSINAALKVLRSSGEFHGPATINVSGACHENVIIESIDRLTLNSVNGASITHVGASSEVFSIYDSRGIAINNFTINGGGGGANGIGCYNLSVCRLSGNTVQGAGLGIVAEQAQVDVTGGTLRNNGTGLAIIQGSTARATDTAIQNNSLGIAVTFHSVLVTNATVTNNSNGGANVRTNGTLRCEGCQFTGNAGGPAVVLRRNSSATFFGGYAITGNTGGDGVQITEESSALFVSGGTVAGNTGGLDVFCGASFTTARGATTDIGGGSTNCVEPSP
jgi:hypothetical protein